MSPADHGGEPVQLAEDPDPRVLRSRGAILDAATERFLEQGYVETSLDDVALRAGVAKRTIYNVVGTKEVLFRAVLADVMTTAERYASQVVAKLGSTSDVDAELHDAAQRLARTVLIGPVVPLRRLLICEARRFPDLAQEYYQRAPGRVMDALAEALRRYHEQGRLRVEDPVRSSEQFAFLILGASLDRALFSPTNDRKDASLIEERARAGVELFLRAHRPASK